MPIKLKNELFGENIFTVDSFLSKTECSDLIDLAEQIGFEPATVHTAGGHQMLPDWRNNTRVVLDDDDQAS